MFNLITSAGYGAATLNLTNDLSILLYGLIGLVWLSAGMIVAAALSERVNRSPRMILDSVSDEPAYREAA